MNPQQDLVRLEGANANPPTYHQDFRHLRYTPEDKERALRLLRQEPRQSYRAIAKLIGPHCSCATICRWDKEHARAERERRMIADYNLRRNQEAADRIAAAARQAAGNGL